MWADDADEAMKTDEHARVTAHAVEQVHQRHSRPAQRSNPRHVTRRYGRRQRNDAGGKDVEQVGHGKIGHQPVVDGTQQTIAREDGQRETIES